MQRKGSSRHFSAGVQEITLIFGIGTDLVDVKKLTTYLLENKSLKEQLFTSSEIQYCEARKSREQNYAARLAAKEAFCKALGFDLQQDLPFSDIEVRNEENGRPLLFVSGETRETLTRNNISHIHLSISHIKSLASAIVILEK